MKSSFKPVSTVMVALAMGAMLGLAGCDQSKAELDSTKQQLATVTADRDNLKSQVTTLQGQLDQAKKDLADAQAKLAAAQAAQQQAATPPPAEEPKKEGKEGKAHHGKAAQAAPKPDTSQPMGTKANPQQLPAHGAGHL